MAPGIFRLRTACCTLVIPVRLAICLPLLIFTLDAYSPHGALFPTSPQQGQIISSTTPLLPHPLSINITRPNTPASGSSNQSPEDTHNMAEYEYIALRPVPPPSSTGAHLGFELTLSFVIAAAALSVLSLVALWWFSDLSCGEDDATIVEGDERAARRQHWVALVLGIATRLLLGGLGTTAMVRVIAERSTIKRDSFIAVEILGWLLVAVLYCGAFHRIHCILWGCSPSTEASQGDKKDMLLVDSGNLVGKRAGSLDL